MGKFYENIFEALKFFSLVIVGEKMVKYTKKIKIKGRKNGLIFYTSRGKYIKNNLK